MKLGLVGFGGFGTKVARSLARVGELTTICDVNVTRQEAATREWAPWKTRVTGHLDDVARDCDAAWVATPTADHEATVAYLLDHGLDVMCEKPVVRDLDVARDLVDMARSRDSLLMGGFLGIHTGCHAALIDNTRPRELTIVRHNTQASLSDGDVLWGLGPHDVASVLALVGSPPNEVAAHGNIHACTVELVWNEGYPLRASIELDWLAPERERAVFRNNDRSFNLAETPDRVEPLLREAREFVRLCDLAEADREVEHRRILDVTAVLSRAHQALQ